MFCLRHRCKVVHHCTIDWNSRLLFGLVAFLRPGKYIISTHGKSISEALKSGWVRAKLTRWLLRRMDIVIACNSDIERECIKEVGLDPEIVHMIPGFIPNESSTTTLLPEHLQKFATRHSPLLFSIAWIGRTYKGSDVYGIDMMIELIARLKQDYPQIGLLLSVAGEPYDKTQPIIETCHRRVGSSIFVNIEPFEDIFPVMKATDIFLRPSNTDGDAVSIREALYLGKPVVTSDAVPRPEVCVLFVNRDMENFEQKVRQTLSSLSELKVQFRDYKVQDNSKQILELYRQLIEEKI